MKANAQVELGERASLFPYSRWNPQLPALSKRYCENRPVPHIHLTDFIDPEMAWASAQQFPTTLSDAWIQYKHHNENTLGMTKRELFPARLREVAEELNSEQFVSWLSQLTGIADLMSDPSLEGGGLHQAGRGGFLNVHTDFLMHHYQKNWRRRVNLILYLNEGWREEWGGDIELWDSQMRQCVAKYPPLLNHALIFNTDERSYHGYPEPLTCPETVSRNSLAFYYYTLGGDGKSVPRSTNYRPRPGDGWKNSALIWLDKQALNFYSRAKARFGFSDELASKILGLLAGKKK